MKHILIAFVIVLTVGCKEESNIMQPNSIPVAFQTLIHDSFEMSNDTNFVVTTLRSRQEANTFIASYLPFITSTPFYYDKLSTVDYQQSMVIVIALGRQGSASISVTIDTIKQVGREWNVYVHKFYPCVQIDMMGNPAHFVSVQQSGAAVAFEPVRVIRKCNGG